MRQHGLFQGHQAFHKLPRAQKGSTRACQRPSRLGNETFSVARISQDPQYIQRHNERTLLFRIIPLIQRRKNRVKKELGAKMLDTLYRILECCGDDVEKGAVNEEIQLYSTKMKIDDGLIVPEESEFGREIAPNIMLNVYLSSGFDATFTKAMAKEQMMKNPKPDYTYGIDLKNFPVPNDVTLGASAEGFSRLSPRGWVMASSSE